MNRIQKILKYRKLTPETLSEMCLIPIPRIEALIEDPKNAPERDLNTVASALNVDSAYIREEKLENFIVTATINYSYNGYSLYTINQDDEVIVPADIDLNNVLLFLCDGAVFISDRNLDEDGAYILRAAKGDVPVIRENGRYFDDNGKEYSGIPILHIVARTRTVNSVIDGIFDSIRHGVTQHNIDL